jgi:hypothetical protein
MENIFQHMRKNKLAHIDAQGRIPGKIRRAQNFFAGGKPATPTITFRDWAEVKTYRARYYFVASSRCVKASSACPVATSASPCLPVSMAALR